MGTWTATLATAKRDRRDIMPTRVGEPRGRTRPYIDRIGTEVQAIPAGTDRDTNLHALDSARMPTKELIRRDRIRNLFPSKTVAFAPDGTFTLLAGRQARSVNVPNYSDTWQPDIVAPAPPTSDEVREGRESFRRAMTVLSALNGVRLALGREPYPMTEESLGTWSSDVILGIKFLAFTPQERRRVVDARERAAREALLPQR